MSRLATTSMYVAGAVVLGALAFFTSPKPPTFEEFSDQGEAFYPDFTDPLRAASLEVIDYDEASGAARPFKVEVRDGTWSIPSHYDYPADGEERLAETAASVIDLKRDIVQSDRVEDHERLGVIDPLDDTTPSLVGRGSRVTLRDASGAALADFIIGREIEGKEGFRYVRLPGKKRVYGVKLDVDLSTRFADWIDTKLLEVTVADLAQIRVSDYSIDETSGSVNRVGEVLLTKGPDGQWALPDVPEGKELDRTKVSALTNALRDLKITGVRPKPPALTADLGTSGGISLDPGTQLSLQSKGFFVSRDGRLLSNEGEVSAGTSKGVLYVLRFGEVFYGDGLEVSAGAAGEGGAGGAGEGEASGSPNRYLFVTAQFDETLLPPEPTPPPGYTKEDAAALRGHDDRLALGELAMRGVNFSVLSQADEGGDATDDAATDDAATDEAATDDAATDDAATDDAATDDQTTGDEAAPADDEAAEAAKRAAEAYETALAGWQQKVTEGRELARTLNERFAAWYYVIAGEDFDDLRPSLDSLLKEKATP